MDSYDVRFWDIKKIAGNGPGSLTTATNNLPNQGIVANSGFGGAPGVYVGASGLDYGVLKLADPGAIDSHFMTGNTLSVLANRISYVFDLHGPSFTIDTACSSSLVAFAQAQAAIAAGQIDTAIVAGVNLLLSPFPLPAMRWTAETSSWS